jgi:hypothetical protein
MSNEFIALIANLALTLSFIVALIFGIAQVRTAERDRRERLTLETLNSFQTREFAELILYITTTQMPVNQSEWAIRPAEERVRFIQFAQQMESVGILVAEKLINLELVDKTLGSLVTTAWEKYKTLFLDMREKQPDPFLGEYFQWLAERIDLRLRTNPRRPYFETGTRSNKR